mmetsp:Transcript_862/g.1854  ORF Transcript_862/g.1854 Transcript_862/m.1854 type:complete len:526 (-) Transcript_862:31-1608(-)
MTGSTDIHRAKVALQNLIQHAKATQGNDLISGDQGFQSALRMDFSRALRPKESSGTEDLATELQQQVARLLKFSSAKDSEANGSSNSADAAATTPTANMAAIVPPKSSLEEVGLSSSSESSDDDDDLQRGANAQEDEEELPRRRRLVREEVSAAPLREQVTQARRQLFELDQDVTKLTRELKQCRQRAWMLQMRQSIAEAKLRNELRQRSSELNPRDWAEEKDLVDDEVDLRRDLAEWKERLQRWYAEAKHQDNILQHERNAMRGSEAPHPVLARHPAGEIFLTFPADDADSDDSDDRRPMPARRAPPPSNGDGGAAAGGDRAPTGITNATTKMASDDSSAESGDDDDDEDTYRRIGLAARGAAGAKAPSAAAPRVPKLEDSDISDDFEKESDENSLPSPSGEPGSMSLSASQTQEKSGESLTRIPGSSTSTMAPPPLGKLAKASSTVTVAGTRRISEDSSSSSSDEDAQRFRPLPQAKTLPKASLPPLSVGQRPQLRQEDDVSEISSEEIEEDVVDNLESSRSL